MVFPQRLRQGPGGRNRHRAHGATVVTGMPQTAVRTCIGSRADNKYTPPARAPVRRTVALSASSKDAGSPSLPGPCVLICPTAFRQSPTGDGTARPSRATPPPAPGTDPAPSGGSARECRHVKERFVPCLDGVV
ncbi:hypothetical protein GCM10010216_18860 [Streptomyces flaveolus]|nr:hypothetical protein GCM10010216_18860 [Streptomyces flaveolus]